MNRNHSPLSCFFDVPSTRPAPKPSEITGSTHTAEILGDHRLTDAEKRQILASWASDVRAVPNNPALRQLDNGAVVHVDDVLQALAALDKAEQPTKPFPSLREPFARRRSKLSHRWLAGALRRKRSDDDDDPPPCPAMIAIPPNLSAWKVAAVPTGAG